MRNPPHERLIYHKTEAAINQIEGAIHALQAGQFDLSITLSGAAEGMMLSPPENLDTFQQILAQLPIDRSKKEWITILNMERDWLKHPTIQMPELMEIHVFEVSWSIVRACVRIPNNRWTPLMEDFKLWFLKYQRQLL